MKVVSDILSSEAITIGKPNVFYDNIAVYPITGIFRRRLKYDSKDVDYDIVETTSDSFIDIYSFDKHPIFFRLASTIAKDKYKRSPLHSFVLNPSSSLRIPVGKSRNEKTVHILEELTSDNLGSLFEIFKIFDDFDDNIISFVSKSENEIGYIAENNYGITSMEIIFDTVIWDRYREDALRLIPQNVNKRGVDADMLLDILSNDIIVRKKCFENQELISGQYISDDISLYTVLLMYKKKPLHFFMRCI